MDLEWTIKPVALALYTRRFMSLLESIRYTRIDLFGHPAVNVDKAAKNTMLLYCTIVLLLYYCLGDYNEPTSYNTSYQIPFPPS